LTLKDQTKSESTQLCKGATPTGCAKYAQASFVIKCLNSHNSTANLRLKLLDTVLFTGLQPRVGKFFDKLWQTKYSKLMDEIKEDWLEMELTSCRNPSFIQRLIFKLDFVFTILFYLLNTKLVLVP